MNDLDFILNFEENKVKGIWLSGIEGEGEFIRYHENGNLRVHSFYENGEKHGECKIYFENGQLWVHAFFKNGKRHGEYKWYWKNGQIGGYSLYENGNCIKDLMEQNNE